MRFAVATLLVAAALAMPTPLTRAQEERPNILVIITDDQRASISFMPQTVQWLQEGGTRFSQAFATTPLCCPSRASIFTGQYAHNHGVKLNHDAEKLNQEETIQRYLQDAGYRTAIVGKYLNEWDLSRDPPYFDRWAIMVRDYYDAEFNVEGSQQVVSRYSTDFIADYSSGIMKDFEVEDDRPWFMYVSTWAPHEPWIPAPEYENAPVGRWDGNPAVRERDKSDKPLYVQRADRTLADGRRSRTGQVRTLHSADELVGNLFRTLEATGELDQTLVFYLTDNGYMWSEHGLRGKPFPYRQAVRIPLLMWWPGRVAEGVVDDRLVGNIDIAPTILEAAGIAGVSSPMDGWSLLGEHVRKQMLVEAWDWRVRPVTGRWASLHTWRFSYTEYYRRRSPGIVFREYYRRRADPWELVNLFKDGKPSNDPHKAPLHRVLNGMKRCRGTAGSAPCP